MEYTWKVNANQVKYDGCNDNENEENGDEYFIY